MNTSASAVPAVKFLLVVCARPDEMVFDLGGVIAAFADSGTTIQAVSLSDGRRSGASAGLWSWLSPKIVDAADELGVSELEILDHDLLELPKLGVNALAREVCGTVSRADAVLASAVPVGGRPSRIAFATASRTAAALGSALFAWSGADPHRRAVRGTTVALDVPAARHRSAIRCVVGELDRASAEPASREHLTIADGAVPAAARAR